MPASCRRALNNTYTVYIHIDILCMHIWREGETNYIFSTSMTCTDYMTEHYNSQARCWYQSAVATSKTKIIYSEPFSASRKICQPNSVAIGGASVRPPDEGRGPMNICVAVSMKWQTPCYSKDDQLQPQLGNWPKLEASKFFGSEHWAMCSWLCLNVKTRSTDTVNSQIHLNPMLLSLISFQDVCTVAKTESDIDIVLKRHVVWGCWTNASFWCLDTLRRSMCCMVRTALVSL